MRVCSKHTRQRFCVTCSNIDITAVDINTRMTLDYTTPPKLCQLLLLLLAWSCVCSPWLLSPLLCLLIVVIPVHKRLIRVAIVALSLPLQGLFLLIVSISVATALGVVAFPPPPSSCCVVRLRIALHHLPHVVCHPLVLHHPLPPPLVMLSVALLALCCLSPPLPVLSNTCLPPKLSISVWLLCSFSLKNLWPLYFLRTQQIVNVVVCTMTIMTMWMRRSSTPPTNLFINMLGTMPVNSMWWFTCIDEISFDSQ